MATDSDSVDGLASVFHYRSCVYTHWSRSLGRVRQSKHDKLFLSYSTGPRLHYSCTKNATIFNRQTFTANILDRTRIFVQLFLRRLVYNFI